MRRADLPGRRRGAAGAAAGMAVGALRRKKRSEGSGRFLG